MSHEQLPPPPSTDITMPPHMINERLAQQLASIPEPPPCPKMLQVRTVQQQQPPPVQQPRARPVGTLEERLAAIPVPPACPLGVGPVSVAAIQVEEKRKKPTGPPPACGAPKTTRGGARGDRGFEHESALVDEIKYKPVAGGWSDGMGGHKIKGSEAAAKGKGGGHRASKSVPNEDGVGGTKIKPVDPNP